MELSKQLSCQFSGEPVLFEFVFQGMKHARMIFTVRLPFEQLFVQTLSIVRSAESGSPGEAEWRKWSRTTRIHSFVPSSAS